MKKKRKTDDSTLAETPKKPSTKKKRLAGMLESMENRSDPVSAHKIATDYFLEFRKERKIPTYPTKPENIKEKEDDSDTEVITPVPTALDTSVTKGLDNGVITALDTEVDNAVHSAPQAKKQKEKGKPFKFEYLDATHNSSEAKVYSVIYRECKRLNATPHRFGLKELKEKTGLSDKTVRVSIHTLEDKLSIKTVEPSMGIYGRKFEVYGPKEILEARRRANIEIDRTTKRIIRREFNAVNTAVDNRVAKGEKTTTVSKVGDSTVSTVDITGHNLNKINKDNSIKEESSSNTKTLVDDIDDSIFDHKKYIISLYGKYTGNKWRTEDNKFYEKVRQTIPDVLEAGVIFSVLRLKAKIKAFAYCEGAINEFNDNFPPGYLIYLREKWKEIKEEVE